MPPTVHYLLEEVVQPSPEDEDIRTSPALFHLPSDEGKAVVIPLEGQQAGHAGGQRAEGRGHSAWGGKRLLPGEGSCEALTIGN